MNTSAALLLVLMGTMAASAQAAEVAGEVGYMNGSLMEQRADGTVKVLGPKAPILQGDVLVTSKDGYAQLKMLDGTVMTMHPDSNLKIEAYQFKKESPQTDNAVFRLLKGAFRTITGLIGKRGNPDAYRLRAAGATIGVRGTDFSTRLCVGQECQGDGRQRSPATAPVRLAVGRVMLLQGIMYANDAAGNERKLLLGSPVFEGERLDTGAQSNAVVAFRDESRITLQADSSFFVQKFKYDKADTAHESAILRLLKGGVRMVTGLIGRINHDEFKFGVAGSSIGIRGTGFDAWCYGACATIGGNPGATLDKPLDGSGVYVWSGAVVLSTPKGSFNVGLQQAAIVARDTGKPVQLIVVPQAIIQNPAPRPDSIPVDMNKAFGAEASTGAPGVYVTVHGGQVILSQNGDSLNLGTGESGFANGRELMRLLGTPAFMGTVDLGSLDKINPNPSINPAGCIVK